MNNSVEYEIRLKDLASSPLTKFAKKVWDVNGHLRKLSQLKNEAFGKLSSVAFGINNIASTFDSVSSKIESLTAANNAQKEAEAKLAQVMRNTMDASDAEIQSIKDLTVAQQKLGVVGDEVQLAGAQELGTYLEKTDSLKKLIPVMNDMVAQQYGFNATQESAVNIATMMGKVMEGQVGALSRYGYKFDEAQEKILKYGTEAQKVKTLSDVISESVGGMNAALAATPEGRMKQLSNTLGDIKEHVGGELVKALVAIMPAIEKLYPIIEKVIDGASMGITKMLPYIEMVIDYAAQGINFLFDKFDAIKNYVKWFFQPIFESINKVKWHLDGFRDYLDPIADSFMNSIIPNIREIGGIVFDMIGGLADFIANSELLKDIFAFVGKIIDSVRDSLTELVKAVKIIWDTVVMPLLNGIEKIYRRFKHRNDPDAVTGASPILDPAPTAQETETKKTLNEIAKNTKANASSGAAAGKAIASSGPKVVNINVQKFFDNINFNTTSLQESSAKIEETVLEVLSRVLVQGASAV